MNRPHKIRGIWSLPLSSVLLLLAFTGAVSGTLAWYAYSTRATLSMKGTTVGSETMLQIGLVSTDPSLKTKYASFASFDAPLDVGDNDGDGRKEYVYFTGTGRGLSSEAIGDYLRASHADLGNQYDPTKLSPVTSGAYSTGDVLSLKRSLIANENEYKEADPASYSVLHFAFRMSVKTDASEYLPNENIYLTGAKAILSGVENEENYSPVRVYFSGKTHSYDTASSSVTNEKEKRFLLSPSDKGESGDTVVAGLLDLNGDGYFDSTTRLDSGKAPREILYGMTEDEANRLGLTLTSRSEDSDVVDPHENLSGDSLVPSTFAAKHEAGVLSYAPSTTQEYDFSSMTGFALPKAHYLALSDVMPSVDKSGYLQGGTPLCTTGNLTTVITSSDAEDPSTLEEKKKAQAKEAIGYLDCTIYVEGWDPSIIDSRRDYSFNLGLQFQANGLPGGSHA